jgi:hypothetical protein
MPFTASSLDTRIQLFNFKNFPKLFWGIHLSPTHQQCGATQKCVAHQPISSLLEAYLDANSNSMQKL